MFFFSVHAKSYSIRLIRCFNPVIISSYLFTTISCCSIFIFYSLVYTPFILSLSISLLYYFSLFFSLVHVFASPQFWKWFLSTWFYLRYSFDNITSGVLNHIAVKIFFEFNEECYNLKCDTYCFSFLLHIIITFFSSHTVNRIWSSNVDVFYRLKDFQKKNNL
jgi:hypothetical protein